VVPLQVSVSSESVPLSFSTFLLHDGEAEATPEISVMDRLVENSRLKDQGAILWRQSPPPSPAKADVI